MWLQPPSALVAISSGFRRMIAALCLSAGLVLAAGSALAQQNAVPESSIAARQQNRWNAMIAARETLITTAATPLARATAQRDLVRLLQKIESFAADITARNRDAAQAARSLVAIRSGAGRASASLEQELFDTTLAAYRASPTEPGLLAILDEQIATTPEPAFRIERRLKLIEALAFVKPAALQDRARQNLASRLSQGIADLARLENSVQRASAAKRLEALAAMDMQRGAAVARVLASALASPLAPAIVSPSQPAKQATSSPVTDPDSAFMLDQAAAGNTAAAANHLRALPDAAQRRRLFRALSEYLANALDHNGVLRPTGLDARRDPIPGLARLPSAPALPHAIANRDLDFAFITGWPKAPLVPLAIIRGANGLDLARFADQSTPVRAASLTLPTVDRRASEIRAAIPAIAPGDARIVPLQHSPYHSKFFEAAMDLADPDGLGDRQGGLVPRMISLQNGVFDLASIIARVALDEDHSDALVVAGRVATLRLPILIGPDATLVLSDVEIDSLHLSTDRGAFISNGGKLFVVDTQVVG